MADEMKVTFANGAKATLRPVSPYTIQAVETSIPRPAPPMQEVDHADGTKHREPNPAHPEHIAALQARRLLILERQQNIMLKLGIQIEMTPKAKKEVAAFRAVASEIGIPLEDDDKLVYLKHICLTDAATIRDVIQRIGRASAPAEEVVAEAAASFKSEPVGEANPGPLRPLVGGEGRISALRGA